MLSTIIKNFLFSSLLLSSIFVFAAKKPQSDLLHLRNGKTLEVVVLDLANDSLHYRLPRLQKRYTIARNEIEKITYKNGTTLSLSQSGEVESTLDEAWKSVIITKKAADIKGMISVEKIDVTLTTGSNMLKTKSTDLEASAMQQLQQDAYKKKATIIYIKESHFKTAYGEPPAIQIKGESFRPIPKSGAKK
ncbi:MAG: hypothetical protein ACTTKZ_05580 [Bacteroides sp.]